eukprot:2951710-Alexandrium_andersonii.AAC.1
MARPDRVAEVVREECAHLRAVAASPGRPPQGGADFGAAPGPAATSRLRLVPARGDQEWGVTDDDDDERPPPPAWTRDAAIREADRL